MEYIDHLCEEFDYRTDDGKLEFAKEYADMLSKIEHRLAAEKLGARSQCRAL